MPSPPILAASALLLLAASLAVAMGIELKRFLARTPVLTSISGIVAFRRAVTRQMYGALAVLALGIAAATTALVGLALGLSEWREVPVLLGAVGLFALVGVWNRAIESQARSIPVGDDEIGRRRDSIVRVWRSRPLPNWRAGEA